VSTRSHGHKFDRMSTLCAKNGNQGIAAGCHHAPGKDIVSLSGPVRKVPRDLCTAAKQLYSITSSARASNEGGTVSPMTLAVLRLITSSNFTGCSMGKSAGFSPLRTFCT
jgi:hypothetical protein